MGKQIAESLDVKREHLKVFASVIRSVSRALRGRAVVDTISLESGCHCIGW